jgi:hypothetical protein
LRAATVYALEAVSWRWNRERRIEKKSLPPKHTTTYGSFDGAREFRRRAKNELTSLIVKKYFALTFDSFKR